MTQYREKATVARCDYGVEDHGILTCSFMLDFVGSSQGFGGLALNAKIGPDFVESVCALFGVRTLAECEGRQCYALRCFDTYNTPIEGLEVEGRRFTLTAWRRKHYPETPNPLEERRERIYREIAHLERRLHEERIAYANVETGYWDWEKS